MKRLAAHYIYFSPLEIYKQHYIELNDNNLIINTAPLIEETENTAFYNGIIFPVALNVSFSTKEILEALHSLQDQYPQKTIFELLGMLEILAPFKEVPVAVYQLDGALKQHQSFMVNVLTSSASK